MSSALYPHTWQQYSTKKNTKFISYEMSILPLVIEMSILPLVTEMSILPLVTEMTILPLVTEIPLVINIFRHVQF
jgi:hypothetical protein